MRWTISLFYSSRAPVTTCNATLKKELNTSGKHAVQPNTFKCFFIQGCVQRRVGAWVFERMERFFLLGLR